MADDFQAQKVFTYNKGELNAIIRSFKGMSDEAQAQAKSKSSALAEFAANAIKRAAPGAPNSKVAQRVADGVKVSKTSKVGELSFGFAGQKFSGGATTQFNYGTDGGNGLLAGAEFGSKVKQRNRISGSYEGFKQFPGRSPRYGIRGNAGYFIYPTLRRIQPELISQWEEAFSQIAKEWDK